MTTKDSQWPSIALSLVLLLMTAPSRSAPLEAYGRLPKIEDIILSPDGSRIAYVQTLANDHRVIAVRSLADQKVVGGLDAGNVKLRSLGWADNSHLMVVTSATDLPERNFLFKREWYRLLIYDLDSKREEVLPDPARLGGQWNSRSNVLRIIQGRIWVRHPNGGTAVTLVTDIYENGEWRPMLVRVDLATYAETILDRGSNDSRDWLIDADGQVVGAALYRESQKRWSLLFRRDGRMTEIASQQTDTDPPIVLGFGPEPDTLLMSRLEDGDPVWRTLSLKDGSFSAARVGRETLDAPIEDYKTYRMVGGVHVDDDARYIFFDPTMQARWDAVVRSFPGEHVRLTSYTADFSKLVVLVNGSKDGLTYQLIDLATMKRQLLAHQYDDVGAPNEVRRITYSASDGLLVPAYVTLPSDKPPKNLPLIVMAHGGPAARDSADFDWWSQALASQGYAVLRANYRGSTLGWLHYSAGFGEWGGRMQTDLSDGVRYLAAQGMIDPARVCIVGASYGGYAALAGVSLQSGIYRCAVSISGQSDLKRFLHWIDDARQGGNQLEQRTLERFTGATSESDPKLDAISPARHADAIQVPVLLIHGQDDTVVPFEQSQEMYDAMRRAHKDVQLVKLKHEDHWLSRGDTRWQMLQVSTAFLLERNPP
ncbi:MAG TPA: prolyl oligopeptidase family serine peptidase [Steroidobacteraceae bacterium]|jgi:dipeptidyl aminopeptidase/acylaminoacyl peptidase|nr:prolyl oligopeptidase family serine peptidase [Steroidobacteraceae bacterium]